MEKTALIKQQIVIRYYVRETVLKIAEEGAIGQTRVIIKITGAVDVTAIIHETIVEVTRKVHVTTRETEIHGITTEIGRAIRTTRVVDNAIDLIVTTLAIDMIVTILAVDLIVIIPAVDLSVIIPAIEMILEIAAVHGIAAISEIPITQGNAVNPKIDTVVITPEIEEITIRETRA